MQITPHVFVARARVRYYPDAYSPNVFIVADGGRAVMIDSGLPDDESIARRLEYLESLGSPKVEQIVITHHHYDHASGAGRLRRATGARVAMNAVEVELLRRAARRMSRERSAEERELRRLAGKLTADAYVADGDALPVGGLTLRVVATPGHSAGHICLLLEEEKVLFSGDNVLGIGTTAIAPPPHGDMVRYLESLRRMQELDAELICPGHGPIVHQPQRKIQELIDHRHERDEQVLTLIGQGKDRLSDIVRGIYPELSPHLERMAQGQILSHLHKLQSEGKVVMRRRGGEVHCRLNEG